MKKEIIIYWATTGIVSVMMLFSAFGGLMQPHFREVYHHLGFPDYFRIELAIAKILGVLVILIPQTPTRVKEWSYAGFGIVFISATIAHGFSRDPASDVAAGILFFVLLVISNIYFHKIKN